MKNEMKAHLLMREKKQSVIMSSSSIIDEY